MSQTHLTLPESNYEKWLLYMKNCPSPASYIEIGWYYLIAAALQRRVFGSHGSDEFYPNIYAILVGRPGLGKGRVIKPVANILRTHKLTNAPRPMPAQLVKAGEEKKDSKGAEVVDVQALEEVATLIAEANGEKTDGRSKAPTAEQPLLIPVAADATSYEALVRAMAKSFRRINYHKPPDYKLAIYTHSSLCFCLEEISSLFRKKTEDTVNFLLQAYDCGDYKYDTKTQGTDNIKKCCLNFFGGTTPDFMQSVFEDALLTQGFSSRTWFIYEWRNRLHSLFTPPMTEEQVACQLHIIEHVKRLTEIVGAVTFEPDAEAFLRHWWEVDTQSCTRNIPNTSEKLESYYSRKNLHVMKLSIIIHFSEVTFVDKGKPASMTVSLACCKKAMEILERVESKMHYALNFGATNPLYKLGQKIQRFVARGGGKSSLRDIIVGCYEHAPNGDKDIREAINFLCASNKLEMVNDIDTKSQKQITMYAIPAKVQKEEHGIIMEGQPIE